MKQSKVECLVKWLGYSTKSFDLIYSLEATVKLVNDEVQHEHMHNYWQKRPTEPRFIPADVPKLTLLTGYHWYRAAGCLQLSS